MNPEESSVTAESVPPEEKPALKKAEETKSAEPEMCAVIPEGPYSVAFGPKEEEGVSPPEFPRIIIPQSLCPCCGLASNQRKTIRLNFLEVPLELPYCQNCLDHQAQEKTKKLLGFIGAIVGVAIGFSLIFLVLKQLMAALLLSLIFLIGGYIMGQALFRVKRTESCTQAVAIHPQGHHIIFEIGHVEFLKSIVEANKDNVAEILKVRTDCKGCH